MSFYRALVEMDLGTPVFPGDILTPEHLAGRDVNVLTRLKYAEFVQEDKPTEPPPTPKRIETVPPEVENEEVAPAIEETREEERSVPVKAEVSKHGVWFKVFAGSMQIGKPTRDEKIAKQLAKEFNAKL